MPYKSYIILFSIGVFFYTDFKAQQAFHSLESDTGKADTLFFFRFNENEFLNDSHLIEEPIVFNQFQRYLPETNLFPYLFVGNPGHSMYSPVYSNDKADNYIQGVSSGVYPYLYRRENADYYRNRPPYTSLFYMFGAKDEELLDVVHTRNFGRNLNLSLHLQKQASTGFYDNIGTKSTNFDMDINYATANQRYTVLASYQFNKKELNENGGYENLEEIENPETEGSANLSRAQSAIRDEGIFIGQSFGIGNRNTNKEAHIIPLFRLGYDFQYTRSYRTYSDEGDYDQIKRNYFLNADFYNNIYFDSTFTRDSVNHSLFSNQANLWFFPSKQRVKLHARQELIDYRQGDFIDTLYENYFTGAEFVFNTSDKYLFDMKFDYAFEGFRTGDFNLSANIGNQPKDSIPSIIYKASLGYKQVHPLFNELYYVSNNFIWHNDFSKQSSFFVTLNVNKSGYSLDVDVGSVANLIYYDDEALAAQATESVQYLKLSFHKFLNWKKIFLDNRLQYQYFSNRDLIPLPEFMIWESIYYQDHLLKKILKFQVGFDVFYYSSHNGYAYMPVMNQFHLQSEKEVGSYPYIDFFINFQLKRAFFFFKMEHVNKGMFGLNYYQVPDYPMPKRAFKMGIKWTLFD